MPEKTCAFPGCDRTARSQGLCVPHYQQQHRGGSLHPIRSPGGRLVHATTIRLTAGELEALRERAEAEGVSVFALARRWVRDALKRS